jgi:hypothetical protein
MTNQKQNRRSILFQIGEAFQLWFEAIAKPNKVFGRLKSSSDKLSISLWILFLFSLMYSFTALILYYVQVLPAIDPWLPIAKERYYLFQTLWTIPWGLATGIMMAGVAYVMASVGRREDRVMGFENAMAVNAIAWIVPSFVFMWLPETLIVPFCRGVPWPSWFEILRLSVLAPVWQIVLTAIGMRKLYLVRWWRAIIIGVVLVGISFIMFLPFMR